MGRARCRTPQDAATPGLDDYRTAGYLRGCASSRSSVTAAAPALARGSSAPRCGHQDDRGPRQRARAASGSNEPGTKWRPPAGCALDHHHRVSGASPAAIRRIDTTGAAACPCRSPACLRVGEGVPVEHKFPRPRARARTTSPPGRPRRVSDSPSCGRGAAAVTPGTADRTPAARHAASSSVARPKIAGPAP